jgi:Ca2+-binding RTX toxin-like protein
MQIRDRMYRLTRLGKLALASVLAALAVPSAAVAATCAFASATATVTLAANEAAIVSVSGTAIRVNGVNCSTATVFNTDTVRVVGAAGNEQLTIDLAGGHFAPGATAEPSDVLEIEIEVDLQAGAADKLVISGTSAADSLVAGENGINLNGDEDADVITLGGVEALTLVGVAGDDLLSAAGGEGTGGPSALAAELNGDAGNDAFVSRAGDDAFTGGAGTDVADYSTATAGVVVDLGASTPQSITPQSTGGAGTDSLSGIENVTGTAFGDVLVGDVAVNALNGGGGPDSLTGGGGNDVLTGADGDDSLAGLAGNDTLDGGDGSDTLDYSAAPAAVAVNLATGGASGAAGSDTIVVSENVVGSDFGDTITANTVANLLSGRAGVDVVDYSSTPAGISVDLESGTVSGGSGSDRLVDVESVTGSTFNDELAGSAGPNVLSGGAGQDTMNGRGGDDTLDGGAGLDTVQYGDAPGRVSVNLTTLASAGAGGADTLTAFEGVAGSAYADVLIGDTAANVLNGAGGRDLVRGLAGNDALVGGPGRDTLDYSSHAPTSLRVGVRVDLARGVASGEGFDLVSQFENVLGSAFEDVLVGDAGANRLRGGRGGDRLVGNRGADVLVGGPGRDALAGGGGRDLLLARDGTVDRVRGGTGRDRGRVDRADRVRSVERRR